MRWGKEPKFENPKQCAVKRRNTKENSGKFFLTLRQEEMPVARGSPFTG